MSSEYSQGAYFQPPQDNLKPRSSRKKAYKYTEEQFTIQPSVTQRYRPSENRHNINDFSFEDRSKKMYTPKREVEETPKYEVQFSPVAAKESNKKKDFDQRINKIENLNDKISNLLKMVPRGSTQKQERANKLKENLQESKYEEKPEYTPRSKLEMDPSITGYTPYRKVEEVVKKSRRTEQRKRNFSYLDELDDYKFEKFEKRRQNEEQQIRPYQQKLQSNQRQSSPISKYQHQSEQLFIQEKAQIQEQREDTTVPIQVVSDVPKAEFTQNVLKANNRSERRSDAAAGYRYRNQPLLQKYREETKTKQKEYQSRQDKENEEIQRREKFLLNNAQLDIKINQIKYKILEESPIKANKNYVQPEQVQYQLRREVLFEDEEQNSTVIELAIKLGYLVDLDIILRKIRHSFEEYRNQKKWEWLRTQLKAKNVYIEEKVLRDMIKISIHERNPFGDKIQAFPLNGVKDLAKLIAQTDRIWRQQLDKFISMDDLARQHFQMGCIDLNHKGFLSIEDLVCFINVHAQKFYRTRDLAQLFRRFLQIEGKNLQKNISDGIEYGSFMGKLCK